MITNRSARLVNVGRATEINQEVSNFSTAIYAKRDALPEGAALYQSLFSSIPEVTNYPNLILVPDGPLHTVAFAALVVDGKRLIETHSIIRAPSASTHILLRQRATRTVNGGLLYRLT